MNYILALLVLLLSFSADVYSSEFDTLKKLAEQGDAGAQFDLGTLYDIGEGVPRDLKEAAKWYRKAAEQGEVAAQYNLAIMFDSGEGVEKDIVKAYAWMAAAEMFGYQGAMETSQGFLSKMTPAQQDQGEALVIEIVNRITKRNQYSPELEKNE